MEELVSCEVCMELFDEGPRCPRMLSCGHTFCSTCIHMIIIGTKCCPLCKSKIDKNNIESIAINYSVKRLTEEYSLKHSNSLLNSLMTVKEGVVGEVEGICETHSLPNTLRCITCCRWICGICSYSSHQYCQTCLVRDAIRDMNEKVNKELKDHAKLALSSKAEVSTILDNYKRELQRENEHLKYLLGEVEIAKNKCENVSQNIAKVENLDKILSSVNQYFDLELQITNYASCSKDLVTLEENLNKHVVTLQEVNQNLATLKSQSPMNAIRMKDNLSTQKQKLLAEVSSKKNVFVSMKEDGGGVIRYGHLDIMEGKLRIHCLQSDPPPPSSVCLLPDQCFATFTGREQWPRKFFLKVASYGVVVGEIIVSLNKETREASKAILHTCLGSKGLPSFKWVTLDERISYIRPCPSFCLPVDVDPQYLEGEVKTKKIWKEGELAVQLWSGDQGIKFSFNIFIERKAQELKYIPAGHVESGLEVCKTVYEKIDVGEEVEIIDCGLLVNLTDDKN